MTNHATFWKLTDNQLEDGFSSHLDAVDINNEARNV